MESSVPGVYDNRDHIKVSWIPENNFNSMMDTLIISSFFVASLIAYQLF